MSLYTAGPSGPLPAAGPHQESESLRPHPHAWALAPSLCEERCLAAQEAESMGQFPPGWKQKDNR